MGCLLSQSHPLMTPLDQEPFWSHGTDGRALVLSFLLEGHTKNAIAKVSSIERNKSSTSLLFVQMHITEAATPPRHDVRSQADGSHGAKL